MTVKMIAEVRSSTSNVLHRIVLRGSQWQCSCMGHFMSNDRTKPCKHILAVQTLNNVKDGNMVQKRVHLTRDGQNVLSRWRQRRGLPLVRPTGWKPSRKR